MAQHGVTARSVIDDQLYFLTGERPKVATPVRDHRCCYHGDVMPQLCMNIVCYICAGQDHQVCVCVCVCVCV